PFEGRIAIRYEIHRASTVTVKIYDLSGRLVRILQPQIRQRAGAYTLTWDGHDANGRRLPNGTYFIELIANHHVKTGKLLLLR
ncbi:MAG: T9SS C-terminal target domain-containing protein, partial [Calditrichaeota bacterium]